MKLLNNTTLLLLTGIPLLSVSSCRKAPEPADSGSRSSVSPADAFGLPPADRSEGTHRSIKVAVPIQLTFTTIPAGVHDVGDSVTGPWHDPTTERRRLVRIEQMAMSTTEITESKYWALVDPGRFVPPDRANLPITNVSFAEATRFCDLLSMRFGMTFRLPTEFEWEVACATKPHEMFGVWRGESPQDAAIQSYLNGDSGKLTRGAAASFSFNAPGPVPVASGPPNSLGLFDMHGNCWEWCQRDPRYDVRGKFGMQPVRGGGFTSTNLLDCRHGHRCWEPADSRKASISFRVVCEFAGKPFAVEL